MSSLNHNPIIKNIPLKDIKPYSNNPRKKQNITKVVNSIKEFGFQQPIVVDKKNIKPKTPSETVNQIESINSITSYAHIQDIHSF